MGLATPGEGLRFPGSVRLTRRVRGGFSMERPCVRVPHAAGEETRRDLDGRGLRDHDHEIARGDDYLYIPVVNPESVPDPYTVVTHDVDVREGQAMPSDLLDFEPSYERLGDVVILHEDDHQRAERIAAAVMASDLTAKTVINRASPIRGEERVREWDVIRGGDTETVHREYGCEFVVDVAAVYFSPRLATERHRVIEQVGPDEQVVDMFAGVGPYAIPMAKRGATVVAVDVNESAIEYLVENARWNGVTDRLTAIHGDVREVADGYVDWADRIVMNLPHSADDFLETATRLAGDTCTIHYYDIQDADAPFEPGEAAIRSAAGESYAVEILTRRPVRSYSPHETNICLDARLTRRR